MGKQVAIMNEEQAFERTRLALIRPDLLREVA